MSLPEADDSLCYSIIGNLLKNAVEAAPEHSTVMVTLIDGPQSYWRSIIKGGTD